MHKIKFFIDDQGLGIINQNNNLLRWDIYAFVPDMKSVITPNKMYEGHIEYTIIDLNEYEKVNIPRKIIVGDKVFTNKR